MSDLVERLRRAANGLWETHPLGDYGLCDEAASRIEQLERETERLRNFVADCAEWTGKGPPTTPWQDIVRTIGKKARALQETADG